MSLTGLLIISLPVSDQKRAKQFYVDQLGFKVVKDGPFEMAGQTWRWIEVAPQGASTSLSLTTWWPQLKPLVGGSIGSTDIDGDYEVLRARGVTFDGPPATVLGQRIALFTDPDGNRRHLTQLEDASPAGEADGRVGEHENPGARLAEFAE